MGFHSPTKTWDCVWFPFGQRAGLSLAFSMSIRLSCESYGAGSVGQSSSNAEKAGAVASAIGIAGGIDGTGCGQDVDGDGANGASVSGEDLGGRDGEPGRAPARHREGPLSGDGTPAGTGAAPRLKLLRGGEDK